LNTDCRTRRALRLREGREKENTKIDTKLRDIDFFKAWFLIEFWFFFIFCILSRPSRNLSALRVQNPRIQPQPKTISKK
jgi:hypothetical protein